MDTCGNHHGHRVTPQIIPAVYNIRLIRNNTLKPRSLQIVSSLNPVVPKDLTGCTINMWIRPDSDSIPLLKLSSSDHISISDAVNGRIVLFPETPPLQISLDAGQYEYDIKITFPSGRELTYIRGLFIVDSNDTD